MSVTLEELHDQAKGQPAITAAPTSDAEEREASRLSEREAVKRRLAEFRLQEQKVAELRGVIDSINAKSDEAAEQHRIATEPLQSELADLHARQLDEITNKQEPNPADADRRQELLRLIAAENTKLETVVESNKATIKKIESEISEQQKHYISGQSAQTCENALADRLARPSLRARMHAMKERLKHCQRWREHAQELVENHRAVASNPKKYDSRAVEYSRNGILRWEAVVNDAGKLATEARDELQQLRQRAIDE